MSRFTSLEGKWVPQKERVHLNNNTGKEITNPSEEGSLFFGEKVAPDTVFIYEGPDRAALLDLYLAGETEFGQDFRSDMDFQSRVRQLGFKSDKDYLKFIGYKEDDQIKKSKEDLSVVNAHKLPERAKEIKMLGGGSDLSGNNNNIYGGFGTPER